jgi:hypothetical protein
MGSMPQGMQHAAAPWSFPIPVLAQSARRAANWLAFKSKKDEAQDAKNKKNGAGGIFFFVGNLRSDSRFVFPQSITVIHEQEVAAGCAEKESSASKERKA